MNPKRIFSADRDTTGGKIIPQSQKCKIKMHSLGCEWGSNSKEDRQAGQQESNSKEDRQVGQQESNPKEDRKGRSARKANKKISKETKKGVFDAETEECTA